MKILQSLLFFLITLVLVSPAHAEYFGGRGCASNELLANIVVKRSSSDESTVCPDLNPPRRAFLGINSRGTVFNPDQLHDAVQSTYAYCTSAASTDGLRLDGIWRGCVAKSIFKAKGQNSFSLSVCTGDSSGGCSSSVYVDRNYYLEIQDEKGYFKGIFNVDVRGVGAKVLVTCTQNHGQTTSGQGCAENIGTETLLPKTIEAINTLIGETDRLKRDAEAKTAAANKRIADAERVLKSIQDKPFDQLTEEDLADFAEAIAVLRTESANAVQLRAEIERQLEDIRTGISQAQTQAKAELAAIGIDVDDSSTYADLVDFQVSPAPLPPLPDPGPLDPKDNVYKLLADKSLEAMTKSLENNNRSEFLQVTLSWAEKNKALLDLYKPRLVASESERAEYELQTKRVQDFVYGADEKQGILDRNGWFKDSLIPVDFQQTIDSMLARDANDPFAVWLKQTMRPMPGKQATIDANTYGLIVLSYSMVTYFNEFRKIYELAKAEGYQPPPAVPPAAGSKALFAGYSWETLTAAYYADKKAIEELKQAGAMGIELYVSTSPVSPLVSLCRLASGNSICRFSGEKDLTGWDYVFSGIESLALFSPLKSMFSMLTGLPLIGGKGFAVSKAEAAGVEMLIAIEKIGLQKAEAKQLVTSAKTAGLVGEEDLKLLASEIKATAAGGVGSFDSAGRMKRVTTRSVLFQGYDTVTCGPTSCSMVLNTLTGREVAIETLVSRVILLEDGTKGDQLVTLLKSEGVSARWNFSTFAKDLETLTARGRPVIVKVKVSPTRNHWLIVDGVTTRLGKKAVAIRDPGPEGAYLELWDSFINRYLKEAVIPNQ